MRFLTVLFLSFIILGQFACKTKTQVQTEITPLVGGDCEYRQSKGKATILEIIEAEGGACPEPRMVIFQFEAEDTPERHNGELLTIQDGKNPSLNWLQQNGIVVGKEFDCLRKEIQSGTCTPVFYEFRSIDLNPLEPCGVEEGVMARLPLDISEQKESYCWISEEDVTMYAQSSEASEIFRVFSKGEVVDVLEGWKLNGTPWIKVNYTGQLRAGYEGELELEDAPKEDIGWVTGDPSFLFRCK